MLQNSQNNSHCTQKMDQSVNYFRMEYKQILKRYVNYFDHFGVECFSSKYGVSRIILL